LRSDSLFLVGVTDKEGEGEVEGQVEGQGEKGGPQAEASQQSAGGGWKARPRHKLKAFVHDIKSLFEPLVKKILSGLSSITNIVMDICDGMAECLRKAETDESTAPVPFRKKVERSMNRALARIHVTVIELEVGHQLWSTDDDVEYMLARIRSARSEQASQGISASASNNSLPESASKESLKTHEALDTFQKNVSSTVADFQARHAICWRVPLVFWRVFVAKCAWVAVLKYSMFIPASMSVLLLMVEIFGDFFVAALFFQSTDALSRFSPAECKESQTVWEQRGTMLAVGILSAYVSMMPAMLLGIFHERDFVNGKMTLAEKKAQVRAWRLRDSMIWTVSIVYISWCCFFTVLFLSNVTRKDGIVWMISALISIAQGAFFIPFVMAAFLVLAMSITLCCKGAQQVTEEVLTLMKEDQEEIEAELKAVEEDPSHTYHHHHGHHGHHEHHEHDGHEQKTDIEAPSGETKEPDGGLTEVKEDGLVTEVEQRRGGCCVACA
jgi:hypothetical protein